VEGVPSMSVLNRNELYTRIVNAIQASNWQVLWPSSMAVVPLDLRVFHKDASVTLRIYIRNLTHGGKTRNKNEYRIQRQGDRFQIEKNFQTLVLGWWDDAGVFAGFDVRKHAGTPGNPSSIQVKKSTLRKAAQVGMAAHEKGNEEIAIAFRPELFMEYVNNLESLHDFGESIIDLRAFKDLLDDATKHDFVLKDDDLSRFSHQRRQTVVTIIRKIRESTFTKRVLSAYGHQCSFCPVQLDLVEGAHILPVAYDDSTDQTSNGIALCSLHHRAYDLGLITMDETYETMINEKRIQQLQKARRDGGVEFFRKSLRRHIRLPKAPNHRPLKAFIRKANELRGWSLH
jgi:putative restriction endonuclease